MITIAVIEDDIKYAIRIRDRILRTNFHDEVSVDLYLNPEDFLKSRAKGRTYQICFSDIIMPKMDGIKLAEEIRRSDGRMLIIFLSSYQEYAPYGYNVSAFGYLLKGKIDDEWNRLTKRIITRLDEDKEKIYRLITPNGVTTIWLEDIVYIYKSGNYCHFVLMEKEKCVVGRMSLYKIEEELSAYKYFVLIKRGYIINIRKIMEYKTREVIMVNGDSIPIGRMHVDRVKEKVMEYMEEL